MPKQQKKRSIFARIRNYFIAGIVVLIPIGITLYLTLFLITISSKILPKEINPNYYLPYNIHGLEIIISIILIVPTTPNPTSGFLLMFPKEEVIYLDLTFEEASKFIVSAGTSNPK